MKGDRPAVSFGTIRSGPALLLLAARLLGPLLLYTLIGTRLHNDLAALVVAAAVPLVVGAAMSIRYRRLDWASAVALVSLGLSLAVAALFGLGATAVKMRPAVAPVIMGLVLLTLAGLPSPRLAAVVGSAGFSRRLRRPGGAATASGGPGQPPSAPSPARIRRLRVLAALWAGGLLMEAAAHVVIVLELSTTTFLLASRAIRWGTLLGLIVLSRALVRRWSAQSTDPAATEPAISAQ